MKTTELPFVPFMGNSHGVQPLKLHSGSFNGTIFGTDPTEDNVLFRIGTS